MARPSLAEGLLRAERERAAQHLQRRLRTLEAREGVPVRLDGRELLNFCSNDYLGLSQHVEVIGALQEAAAWDGAGAGSAHLVSGHLREHALLEEAVAEWQGYPRALLFGSGYLANLGVLQALLSEREVCVQDKLNHACLLDGARLSGAELKRYPHGDVEAAMRQLQSRPEAAALLATDGVFSMDGDLAPLKSLALLCRAENATLYVDDAHGAGVIGHDGRGSVAHAGLTPRDAPLQLITLGKALGAYGAVVVGSEALVEAVLQKARPYLFTTALPPGVAAAARAGLRIARKESWRRFKLTALTARFRRGAQQLGLPLMDSNTPIQPLLVGGNEAALAASRALEERGFLVAAIRPPTVPEGRARLRVTLCAEHSEAQVDALLEALSQVCRKPSTVRA